MRSSCLAIVLVLAGSACSAARAAAQVIAYTNATVIDGTGAAPRAATTIVVRDGRIVALQSAGAPVPRGAVVRDLTGKFVIPGLIDAHVHLGTQQRPPGTMEAVLRAVFLGGVTAIRDMGGRHDIVRPLAEKGAVDTVPMPRVSMAAIVSGGGMWIEGERAAWFSAGAPPGESPMVRRLRTRDDVEPAVTAAKAAGARGIKIYNAIEPELVRAVADEARRQRLHVWSHLWVDPGLPSEVLDAGAEVVSHTDMWVAELLPERLRRAPVAEYRVARHGVYTTPRILDRTEVSSLLRAMKERGTILDATLFVMRPGRDSAGRVDERHAALFAGAVEFARRAHRARIDIAAGTDAIGGSSPNLHTELQLLVDSVGLTPVEAIRAATHVNARALGLDDAGVVAVGKRADLVVLEQDPARDIANTITVFGVVKAGRLFTRERPMPTPPGARAPKPAR